MCYKPTSEISKTSTFWFSDRTLTVFRYIQERLIEDAWSFRIQHQVEISVMRYWKKSIGELYYQRLSLIGVFLSWKIKYSMGSELIASLS